MTSHRPGGDPQLPHAGGGTTPRLSICAGAPSRRRRITCLTSRRHSSRTDDMTPSRKRGGERDSRNPSLPPTRAGASQRQRRASELHGTPQRTQAPLARQLRTPYAQGGTSGGIASPVRETSAPLHLTLAAPMLQRSCYEGPRHSVALARIITPARHSRASDFSVFERRSLRTTINMLVLFASAGGLRPRHPRASRTRFNTPLHQEEFKTALALQSSASASRPDS